MKFSLLLLLTIYKKAQRHTHTQVTTLHHENKITGTARHQYKRPGLVDISAVANVLGCSQLRSDSAPAPTVPACAGGARDRPARRVLTFHLLGLDPTAFYLISKFAPSSQDIKEPGLPFGGYITMDPHKRTHTPTHLDSGQTSNPS